MDNMARIQNMSRRFRLFFTSLLFLIPALNALYWIFFNHFPNAPVETQAMPVGELPALTRSMAFMASLLPVGVVMYGILTLAKLFRHYENGNVFTAETVRYFHALGYVTVFWVFANMLFTSLISVIFSFNNPPGERMLTIEFGTPDLTALTIGAILLLVSWVMEEGRKLEDEQAHTI